MVQPHKQTFVIEIIIQESLLAESLHYERELVAGARRQAIDALLNEQAVQLVQGGIILIKQPRALFRQCGIQQELDENMSKKTRAKTLVTGQLLAHEHREFQA